MGKEYSIGEFAKRTGVTIRTLHYYDERGILIPERSENGRRIYHDADLSPVEQVI